MAAQDKKSKTTTLKFEWTWRAHMASLIRFLEQGNADNKQFAYDELMKLADQLDIVSPIQKEDGKKENSN
mgnify:CR=1 FL=1|tara:strand:- start:100 stop:309 length:210 start_codon:yes stop_codon:yes gene_type:complete